MASFHHSKFQKTIGYCPNNLAQIKLIPNWKVLHLGSLLIFSFKIKANNINLSSISGPRDTCGVPEATVLLGATGKPASLSVLTFLDDGSTTS